jgi:tetraacyldisaccharide 4'-kinase
MAIDRVWYGDDPLAWLARLGLAPFAALYRGAAGVRNALYDRGVLAVHPAPLPAVSVGNLAVGGAGKTPVAAWLAGLLRDRGARPAVVLRGYGADEPDVHALLNPTVPVIVAADRVAGMEQARQRGCDVAVLDDAFQHRRAARAEDVVLVSADRFAERRRALPAGPWREPLAALGRASMVIVTRKAASADAARTLLARLVPMTRGREGICVALTLSTLHEVDGTAIERLERIRGRRVLAISGIADPAVFQVQLAAAGAIVEPAVFADHHRFSAADAAALAHRARGVDYAVCTLKDAVKLRGLWPREAPAPWYVSLRCDPEGGSVAVDGLLARLLAARQPRSPRFPDPR